jgi:hypothetical protein
MPSMNKLSKTTATKVAERTLKRGRALLALSVVCAGLGMAVTLSFDLPAGAQTPSGSSGTRTGLGRTGVDPLANDDGYDGVMAERRLRALNAERQKQMVSDTNKLLRLARELNDEVATTSSDSFTPDQLRKIAEIEKLARSVRERMTSGVGEGPNMQPGPTLIYPVHQGP